MARSAWRGGVDRAGGAVRAPVLGVECGGAGVRGAGVPRRCRCGPCRFCWCLLGFSVRWVFGLVGVGTRSRSVPPARRPPVHPAVRLSVPSSSPPVPFRPVGASLLSSSPADGCSSRGGEQVACGRVRCGGRDSGGGWPPWRTRRGVGVDPARYGAARAAGGRGVRVLVPGAGRARVPGADPGCRCRVLVCRAGVGAVRVGGAGVCLGFGSTSGGLVGVVLGRSVGGCSSRSGEHVARGRVRCGGRDSGGGWPSRRVRRGVGVWTRPVARFGCWVLVSVLPGRFCPVGSARSVLPRYAREVRSGRCRARSEAGREWGECAVVAGTRVVGGRSGALGVASGCGSGRWCGPGAAVLRRGRCCPCGCRHRPGVLGRRCVGSGQPVVSVRPGDGEQVGQRGECAVVAGLRVVGGHRGALGEAAAPERSAARPGRCCAAPASGRSP